MDRAKCLFVGLGSSHAAPPGPSPTKVLSTCGCDISGSRALFAQERVSSGLPVFPIQASPNNLIIAFALGSSANAVCEVSRRPSDTQKSFSIGPTVVLGGFTGAG